ncbi:MAG: glycosyltransferase family 4 protein [Methanothrix sp.]
MLDMQAYDRANFKRRESISREALKYMYKILFISHASGVCGSEQALYALIKGLDTSRYDPIVAVPSDGPLRKRLSEIGIRTFICPVMTWMPFKQMPFFLFIIKYHILLPIRIMRLMRLVKNEKVDLVFSNELLLLEGGIAARLTGIAHIYHVHNTLLSTYFRTYLPVEFIKWLTLKLADRMVFVSQRQMQELFGRASETKKLRVVTQGFDVDHFSGEEEMGVNWRLKSGISRNSPLAVLIATSVKDKGQEDFLKAAQIVSRSLPDAKFAIIGGGNKSYIEELNSLTLLLGIDKKVFFVDFMEDITPVYSALDVLVCASMKETFGRTIVEAMLAGKPVVSTRCGGPEEIVIDGVTGLLIPLNSPDEMARAILRMLRDRQLASQMGREGKRLAERCYSMQMYARNMQEVLEECISEHRMQP